MLLAMGILRTATVCSWFVALLLLTSPSPAVAIDKRRHVAACTIESDQWAQEVVKILRKNGYAEFLPDELVPERLICVLSEAESEGQIARRRAALRVLLSDWYQRAVLRKMLRHFLPAVLPADIEKLIHTRFQTLTWADSLRAVAASRLVTIRSHSRTGYIQSLYRYMAQRPIPVDHQRKVLEMFTALPESAFYLATVNHFLLDGSLHESQVQRAYYAYLGNPPSVAQRSMWLAQMQHQRMSLEGLHAALLASIPESRSSPAKPHTVE